MLPAIQRKYPAAFVTHMEGQLTNISGTVEDAASLYAMEVIKDGAPDLDSVVSSCGEVEASITKLEKRMSDAKKDVFSDLRKLGGK